MELRALARAEVDVSLAEKMLPSETPSRTLNAVATPNLDNILRLALNGVGQKGSTERRQGEIDFNKAASLLDRATNAISHLTARRDELEEAAAAREEYFADRVRQLQEQATEWERRAKVIKAQLQDCEIKLSEQQVRIETLSYRAESAEARVLIAEQQAADARSQLQMYHDKIIDTFGALG